MSIYDFAKECFENNGYGFAKYTAEDSAADLENFRAAGWDLPDGITPEELAAAVNDVIAEAQDQDAE